MFDGTHSSNRKVQCEDSNSAFKTAIVSTIMGVGREGTA